MPSESSSRTSGAASALLALVALVILFPLGAIITTVVAQTMGGNLPPQVLISADPLSDGVSATAAEFRVDESGAATYSIPLYLVPGTAGVAPQLTLSYSSQGGDGPVGKGWAVGGLSSIARCRATREAGDFIGGATPDGNPRPINFSATDRFCLDGQRLVPSSATCPAASGMTAAALATELDSFSRICAYSTGGSTTGPSFFTVDRKDGSTSWYGDRDNNNSSNRPDGYFETNSPLNPGAALSWAQTRFQDSSGNYVDYHYLENPAGAGTGEQLISEVRYTGKTVLPGQTGSASAPYARVVFNYGVRAASKWSNGYASGGTLTQSRILNSITSCATIACGTAEQARQYLLTYAPAASGANLDTLIGLQECRDSTGAVCAAPTSFAWTQGRYEFATQETPANLVMDISSFSGFKFGDLNGDGRSDLVYLRSGTVNCAGSFIVSALSILDGSGRPAYGGGGYTCLPAAITTRGEGAWHLVDYNGDGRDDLFVSGPTGQGWRVYPSNGSGFDASQNLIAGLSSIIPSYAGVADQVQMADLNGDGLTDVVYPSNGAMRARTMTRVGGGFEWGAERTIAIDEASLGSMGTGCETDPNVYCTRSISGAPTIKTSFQQLADFNGDASSDLLIHVNVNIERYLPEVPGCEYTPQRRGAPSEWTIPPYETSPDGLGANSKAAAAPLADPCWQYSKTTKLHAFFVKMQDTATVGVSNYGSIAVGNPFSLSFADANGDGLTDVFYRATTNHDWNYQINTGNGFLAGGALTQTDYRDQTRFQDVNGDGRADALVLTNYGSYKAYAVRYAIGTGGYAAATAMPGGGARLCTGSCNQDQYVPMFSDIDADGNTDFMSLKMENNPALYVSRSGSRFSPRDAIIKIVNGFGAETDLTYATLTNKDIYRRDYGSRNSPAVGRGSPVSDVLAPSYVVAKVSSSSPRINDAAAKASLYYRYAGAKVQAGGRGFLGFREVITIDPNQTGGYVATTTQYSQVFPFVGAPTSTTKAAVIGGTYTVPSCLASGMTESCYATPGQFFAGMGGSLFSNKAQVWEVAPNSLATQVPLHVRTLGTEEILRDPYTGAQTNKIATAFSYVGNGNVSQVIVQSFNGAEGSPAATMITDNTYVDDLSKWRLGRLTASTITHRRPGQTDVVKTTGFAYEMGGPTSGLLTEEKTQPGGSADQALSKSYVLDQYGNRVQSTICAAPATCGGFAFHPASSTNLVRYSKVQYDAQGRFPVATVEPFWTDGGGEERVTNQVVERNIFGDATNTLDVNFVRNFQVRGILGREYFSWSQTSPNASPGNGGLKSITTYRWCGGQVSCPVGAKARQQVASQGSPRKWNYLDALGRSIMSASETLNAGVIDQDVAASCTEYDVAGRARRASNPFFLAGVAGESGPTGVENVCIAGERLWTTTTFDILGRPTLVVAPDGSQVSNTYNGLATTAIDPRGNPTTQTRNAKGELATVVDAANLTTAYTYTADGNLKSVSRDAGAGTVVNSFTYDSLGRRIQQVDPDSGTTNFSYNALGELVAQVDGEGQRVEFELDARGRVWRKTVKQASSAIETQSTFVFDTAMYGSGQLASETISGTYSGLVGQTGAEHNYTRYHYYDALGRPASQTTMVDQGMYGAATEYDALGRPWRIQDASGLWTKTQYSSRGVVAFCATDFGDLDPACQVAADTFQRILATDAWGNVVKERRGGSSAMEVARTFHAQTGRIASICAGNISCNLTNEGYGWDGAGNLSSHQKETRYLEAFQYDALNRVVEAKVLTQNGMAVNTITLAQGYDKLGNVCMKNGIGFDYAGADGCGGAAAMSSTQAPMSTARAFLAPTRRPQEPAWKLPAAWRETKARQAPETATRRYSDRKDEPSWEREADSWGRDDLEFSNEPILLRGGRFQAPVIRTPARQQVAALATVAAGQGAVGIMSGGVGSPHAVSQAGAGTGASFYYYDSHGNQTSRDAPGTANDRTIKYSVDNKAYEITMGSGQRVRFWYGPDGQRYKREEAGKTTLYLDGVEVVLSGGIQSVKRYVGGVAIQTVSAGVVSNTKYLFMDHLGSLVRIANADGSVADSLDYSTFGARRSYTNPTAPGSGTATTDRSFTGHEAIDGTGVVHMNGRIYDVEVGRFMQADPVIQAPDNAQSWNAYTYCFNNPLAYTDPSGNISFRQILGIAIAIIGTYITMGMDGGFFAKLGVAIAFGAASGYVATGTLRGALTGAFTAGITMGIGQLGLDIWGRMALQSMTGGIVESINGGSFGNGFLAAGLTAGFMPQLGGISNDFVRTAAGAMLGGTISKATGGKFINGAVSGAIQGAMAGKPPKVEKYFEHAQLPDGQLDGVPSEMPNETRSALQKILRSPLGKKLSAYMDANGGKIRLTETPIADAFTVTSDNEIWYTRDVAGYVQLKINEGNSLPGDGLSTSTLDSLLVHEIGHTVIGSAAIGQIPIPVYNRADSLREETRAIQGFENPYRKTNDMPLRCSYWTEGDLCN